MRSERHFFATVNYVHNNPVHHGYVRLWTEWPWSGAAEYLAQMGRAEAERVWKEYPTRDSARIGTTQRCEVWSPGFAGPRAALSTSLKHFTAIKFPASRRLKP